MPVSLQQLIDSLSQSGLMRTAEVQSFLGRLPPGQRPADGDCLVAELVRADRLTQYQAAAVLQGKAKNLIFDEYVILDKLGQGGMGVVLKARHRRMDRLVAVKVLPRSAMKSPQAVERFYREVKAAAKLSHPNIVAAHDAREHAGTHCLVMEYVEGRDLAAIVKEHGPLPVRQAAECILQAARALDYAHRQGVIHRDIKPGNLLLDREGTVKILDMGLARIEHAAAEEAGERLTESGQVMGTCDYMAPEQAMDTHTADGRSDVYSLGCTLYRLLTGKPPYQGDTLVKILLAHQQAPIPSLCDARPDAPIELDAIFRRMVAKEPRDRQQTMGQVIEDVENFLGLGAGTAREEESLTGGALSFLREMTEGGSATGQRVQTTREDTFQHPARPESATGIGRKLSRAVKHPKLMAIGGAAVVLLAVGLVVLQASRRREPARASHRPAVPAAQQAARDDELQAAAKRWGLERQGLQASQMPQGGFTGTSHFRDPTSASRFAVPDGTRRLPSGAPPPAVAPFDAKQARAHQEAWAKYLNVPVETTNSIGMKFVLVPPGEFTMGSTAEEIARAVEEGKKNHHQEIYVIRVASEGPAHRVKISRPFRLGAVEVTQEEYQRVMGVNPSEIVGQGQDTSRHPVEMVSREDAVEFCRRLSALQEEQAAKRTYRLPTEAEWEYACRAGASEPTWRDEQSRLEQMAWIKSNSGDTSHPVGRKLPNPWGLHDVFGNVFEWCGDVWSEDYYQRSPPADPTGPASGSRYALRGAAFDCPASMFRYGYRHDNPPDWRRRTIGFRVVMD